MQLDKDKFQGEYLS